MTSEVITVSLRRADTPLSRRVVVRLEQSLDAEGLWALAKRTLGITSPAPVGVAVDLATREFCFLPSYQRNTPRPGCPLARANDCVPPSACVVHVIGMYLRSTMGLLSLGPGPWIAR
jgi:hypothetical protein